MSTSPEHVIQEAVSRIVALAHPARVILFGSHARGDAHARSDIDLLVLVDDDVDPWQINGEIYLALRGIGRGVDIVVLPLSYFERNKGLIGTVALPAAREGKVLYQRAA